VFFARRSLLIHVDVTTAFAILLVALVWLCRLLPSHRSLLCLRCLLLLIGQLQLVQLLFIDLFDAQDSFEAIGRAHSAYREYLVGVAVNPRGG